MPLRNFHCQSQEARAAGYPRNLLQRADQASYRWHLKLSTLPIRELLRQVWLAAFIAGWAAHRRAALRSPALNKWESNNRPAAGSTAPRR